MSCENTQATDLMSPDPIDIIVSNSQAFVGSVVQHAYELKHPFTQRTVDYLRNEVSRLDASNIINYRDVDCKALMQTFHAIVDKQFENRITHGPASVSSFVGISVMELLQDCNLELDTAEAHDILRSIMHLHEEGFIYSTIDEYHYLATALGDK